MFSFLIYFFQANLGTFVYVYDPVTGQKVRNEKGEAMFTACDGQHRCQFMVCNYEIIFHFFFSLTFIFLKANQMETESTAAHGSDRLSGYFKSPIEFQ